MLQPSCNLAACTEIWKGWKELIEILEMTDDDKYDKWWGNSERNLPWAMLTAPFTDTAPELVWKVPVPGRWQHYSRILNRSLPVGPDAQASWMSKLKHTTEGPGTSRSIKVATWQCEARSSCNITWDLHQARYTNQNCSRQILNICRYECGVVRECAYRNPSAVIRTPYTYFLLVEVCWSYVSKTGLSLLCTIRCKVLRVGPFREMAPLPVWKAPVLAEASKFPPESVKPSATVRVATSSGFKFQHRPSEVV